MNEDIATWEEIIRLERRVLELEYRFGHRHEAHHDGTDLCGYCGFDLRDPLHVRVKTPGRKENP